MALAESWIQIKFEPSLPAHTGYHVLAALPPGPVLELPIYSRRLGFRRSRYMLDSTVHWMPLVDAYSDSIPPEFDARQPWLPTFPATIRLNDMKRDQVRYAVIHLDAYDEPTMRRSLFERLDEFALLNLRQVFDSPDMRIYEVIKYVDRHGSSSRRREAQFSWRRRRHLSAALRSCS